MLKLPDNPKGIRVLQSWESERLRSIVTDRKKLPPTPQECITCKGRGTFRWYNIYEGESEEDYECNCREQWILHRYFLYNGVGTHLQRIGWMLCTVPPNVRRPVEQYLMDKDLDWNMEQGIGLYLYGPKGTGKSLMASILLRRTLSMGYEGHYTSFHEMREAKTNEWKDEGRSEWFMKKITDTTVLVIDDPGQENMSEKSLEFSRTILDSVIRHRMTAGFPTIITSNQSPEDFRHLYGGYVDSLVQERMIPLYVPGNDYRPNMKLDLDQDKARGLTRPIVVS